MSRYCRNWNGRCDDEGTRAGQLPFGRIWLRVLAEGVSQKLCAAYGGAFSGWETRGYEQQLVGIDRPTAQQLEGRVKHYLRVYQGGGSLTDPT